MNVRDWDTYFPHFAPEEYYSPEGMKLFSRNTIPNDPIILHQTERLREELNRDYSAHLGKEITLVINIGEENLRGFVTPGEWVDLRYKEPDQLYSFHLWCAVDLHSPEVPVGMLFEYAKRIGFNGIIKYKWGLHLDYRRGETYIDER